nr:hypothetical protein [Bacillus sp. NTK071]
MLDSCGTSGTGETPQERMRRGGSPPAPRKASILERKLTHSYSNKVYEKSLSKRWLLLKAFLYLFTC